MEAGTIDSKMIIRDRRCHVLTINWLGKGKYLSCILDWTFGGDKKINADTILEVIPLVVSLVLIHA